MSEFSGIINLYYLYSPTLSHTTMQGLADVNLERFQCKICKNLYDTLTVLVEHVFDSHEISSICCPIPYFRCNMCKERFLLESEHYNHKCNTSSEVANTTPVGAVELLQDQMMQESSDAANLDNDRRIPL